MDWRAIAQEILDNGYIAGVRSLCDDEDYAVGDDCRPSYEWDLENDCSAYYTTGELAVGTCATSIDTNYFKTDNPVAELAARLQKVAQENKSYGGKRQAIIVGHRVNNDGYFDPDEVRIIDATVLAIIE